MLVVYRDFDGKAKPSAHAGQWGLAVRECAELGSDGRRRGGRRVEHRSAGVVGQEFAAQGAVVFGAGRGGGVAEDRLAEAGGFGEADVAADARFEEADIRPGAGGLAGLAGGM